MRFKELSGGILYSEIAPKAQLPCLAPHFAERLSDGELDDAVIGHMRNMRFMKRETMGTCSE